MTLSRSDKVAYIHSLTGATRTLSRSVILYIYWRLKNVIIALFSYSVSCSFKPSWKLIGKPSFSPFLITLRYVPSGSKGSKFCCASFFSFLFYFMIKYKSFKRSFHYIGQCWGCYANKNSYIIYWVGGSLNDRYTKF